MGVAIQTHYLGTTNHRPSRIVAQTTNAKPSTGKKEKHIQAWEHGGTVYTNHCEAARALAVREKFVGVWIGAELDDGFVFVRLIMSKDGALPALLDHIAFVVE